MKKKMKKTKMKKTRISSNKQLQFKELYCIGILSNKMVRLHYFCYETHNLASGRYISYLLRPRWPIHYLYLENDHQETFLI